MKQIAKEVLLRCMEIRIGNAKHNHLTCAAFHGKVKIVRFLIELKFPIDSTYKPLVMTALHYTIMIGHD